MSKLEFARLDAMTYVYGTYEEVEEYCSKNDYVVDRYLNHVNPSTVYSQFKYVGARMHPPYEVAKQFYEKDENGFAIGIKVFKEKF